MHVRQIAFLAALTGLLALAVLTSAGARSASNWVRVAHPALEGGGSIAYVGGVLAPSPGRPWTAGGWVTNADGVRFPVIWESRDGRSWRRTGLPPSSARERRDGVYMIARKGSTEVALGERFDDGLRNAAWVGQDGRWSALRDDRDPLLDYPGRIIAVSGTGDGFLAVAAQQLATSTFVRIFMSDDGRSWKQHSDLPLVGNARFFPSDVEVADERIVLAGHSAGRGADAEIWIWAKGAWDRAAGFGDEGNDRVGDVAYRAGNGWLAGGHTTRNGVEQPMLWTSADAVIWRRATGALPFQRGGAAVHDIAVSDAGFDAAANSPSGVLLWRSTNGRTWTLSRPARTASVGGETLRVAAAGGQTLVTIMRETGSDVFRRQPSGAWTVVDRPPAFPASAPGAASLAGVAVNGARLVAVGNDARDRPLVMISRNGRSWTRAPFDDRAARLMAVAANRGTFVIAGWRLIRGRAYMALWSSRAGRSWKRLGGDRFSPVGAFVDVASDAQRFAVVGFEGTPRSLRTVVWSGNGSAWSGRTVLGNGAAQAICVGPNGATVVAARDGTTGEQIVAWQRGRTGRWSRDPEILARASNAYRCEDTSFGTFVVGSDSGAVMWSRPRPGERWERRAFAVGGALRQVLYDVTRDGRSVILSGSGTARGQLDLAIWRVDARTTASVGGADPVFTAPGAQAGLGIVGYKGRIVVVGRSGAGDAAIWVGRDRIPVGEFPSG